MSEDNQLTVEMTHVEGLEFSVRFDPDGSNTWSDKPFSVGGGAGPSASRLLAVAAANCLSASLLYCVAKNSPPAGSLKARAVCRVGRNEKGRSRVGSIEVTLEVNGEFEQAVRMQRCLGLYEEFSVAAVSLRQGFPVKVRVVNERGETLHQNPGPESA